MKRSGFFLTSSLAFLLLATGPACGADQTSTQSAASYPEKPIRILVGYAPGGATDSIARILGQKLGEAWGQQVQVENRPGASSNIAAEVAARSKPDGHTLFMLSAANAINPALYPKLNYDPVRDFAFVSNVAKVPGIVIAHPSLPIRNITELISLAKSRPDGLRYASAGQGSPSHLTGHLFTTAAGVKIIHIPYKGAGPALIDCAGGHVETCFAALASAMPHVKSGRLRALGVTSLKRVEALPEIATLDEQGLKGFEASSWFGVVVPAGTPVDVVGKLHTAIVAAVADTQMRNWARTEGAELIGDSPRMFSQFFKAELAKWGKAVRESGAKVE